MDEYFREYSRLMGQKYLMVRECEFMKYRGQLRRWDMAAFKDKALMDFCKRQFPYYNLPNQMTGREILDRVINGSFTGFVTCSVRVQDEFREQFSRFPPLYIHRLMGKILKSV